MPFDYPILSLASQSVQSTLRLGLPEAMTILSSFGMSELVVVRTHALCRWSMGHRSRTWPSLAPVSAHWDNYIVTTQEHVHVTELRTFQAVDACKTQPIRKGPSCINWSLAVSPSPSLDLSLPLLLSSSPSLYSSPIFSSLRFTFGHCWRKSIMHLGSGRRRAPAPTAQQLPKNSHVCSPVTFGWPRLCSSSKNARRFSRRTCQGRYKRDKIWHIIRLSGH